MTRHPSDLISLVFGLLFLGIGLVLLSGVGHSVSMALLGPLMALGLGGLLVVAGLSRGRDDRTPPPTG
jgi:hypothetical protein